LLNEVRDVVLVDAEVIDLDFVGCCGKKDSSPSQGDEAAESLLVVVSVVRD
jgi:hypothetical protein